jgi:hypothetical protein
MLDRPVLVGIVWVCWVLMAATRPAETRQPRLARVYHQDTKTPSLQSEISNLKSPLVASCVGGEPSGPAPTEEAKLEPVRKPERGRSPRPNRGRGQNAVLAAISQPQTAPSAQRRRT